MDISASPALLLKSYPVANARGSSHKTLIPRSSSAFTGHVLSQGLHLGLITFGCVNPRMTARGSLHLRLVQGIPKRPNEPDYVIPAPDASLWPWNIMHLLHVESCGSAVPAVHAEEISGWPAKSYRYRSFPIVRICNIKDILMMRLYTTGGILWRGASV